MEAADVSEEEFGVLIHGAGWVATQHANAVKNNPHARVAAVSSRSRSSAQRLADEYAWPGTGVYDDLDEALRHDGVDVVAICTPQHVHCQNVLAAAGAGKHIIIEKPAAISIQELREMRDAVNHAGVKTIVSFVLRWNPLFQNIKRLIANETLGEIYCVETDYQSYNSDWWGGWEDGRRADTGVSAMAVAGCHAIDALRWFAAPGEFDAADPIEVFAYAGGRRKGTTRQFNPITNDWHEGTPLEYDGLEIVLVRFANGVLGKVSANFECIQPYIFPLEIFGDRGTIKNNRRFCPRESGDPQWIEIPGVCPESSDVSHHPFQGQFDHFIECLSANVESHCNLADAIKTHEVVFAAQQCYQTGQPVPLPLI